MPPRGRLLVIDIGGTRVKCYCGEPRPIYFASGRDMTPERMVRGVLEAAGRRRFAGVSIGYPGVVRDGRPALEPVNLGRGWVDYDYAAALGAPVRMLNDAALQALGSYRAGTLLFLGLGTGLGTAAVASGAVLPLEFAHLPYKDGRSYEEWVGAAGLKRLGLREWRRCVVEIAGLLRRAFVADDLALGGGNAARVIGKLPQARLVGEESAFHGGVRLWAPAPPAAAPHGSRAPPGRPAPRARRSRGE